MQLTYMTRVDLSSKAAQARQVQCMARAFSRLLGSEFLLASNTPLEPTWGVQHQRIPCSAEPRLRHLGACALAAARTLMRRDQVVFTRDIAVAVVVTVLGGRVAYETHKAPQSGLPKLLTHILAKAKRFQLVAISAALSDYYRDHYGIPDDRRLVAHDGVFPEEYEKLLGQSKSQLRDELDLPQHMKIIVHTGSLYKGGAELFGEITRGRQDVLFVHIGGSQEECDKWDVHYRQSGEHLIRFIPHQDSSKIRKYQVAADALFYVSTRQSPIYWCTSPLKIFEYMASGTPIIGARIGSVCEILNDDNAFCFDPDRPETIREIFSFFASDPDAAQEKGAAAAREAQEYYSWHKRAARIWQFASTPCKRGGLGGVLE
jgi:glycosyltransferase involved in cell wall biosynthesis